MSGCVWLGVVVVVVVVVVESEVVMAGSGGAVTILYHHILWYTTTGRGQQCSLLQWPDLYSLSLSLCVCCFLYSTPLTLYSYTHTILRTTAASSLFFSFSAPFTAWLSPFLLFFSAFTKFNYSNILSLSLSLSLLAVTNSNADPRVANRFRCRTASNQPSNTIWESSLANLLSLITADR